MLVGIQIEMSTLAVNVQDFPLDCLVNLAFLLSCHVFGLPFNPIFHLQYVLSLLTNCHLVANIDQYFDVILKPLLVETEVSLHQLWRNVKVDMFITLFSVLVEN